MSTSPKNGLLFLLFAVIYFAQAVVSDSVTTITTPSTPLTISVQNLSTSATAFTNAPTTTNLFASILTSSTTTNESNILTTNQTTTTPSAKDRPLNVTEESSSTGSSSSTNGLHSTQTAALAPTSSLFVNSSSGATNSAISALTFTPYTTTPGSFNSSTTPTNTIDSLLDSINSLVGNSSNGGNQWNCLNITSVDHSNGSLLYANDTSISSADVMHSFDEPFINLTTTSPISYEIKNISTGNQPRYHQLKQLEDKAFRSINSEVEMPLPITSISSVASISSVDDNNNKRNKQDFHSAHKKNSDIISAATSRIAEALQQPPSTSNITVIGDPTQSILTTVPDTRVPLMPLNAVTPLPTLNWINTSSLSNSTSSNPRVIKLPPVQSSFENIYLIGDTGNATIHRENQSLSVETTNNY